MSISVAREIIQRAKNDSAFRQQLLNDPAAAVAGYDLTAQEQQRFEELTADILDKLTSGQISVEGWITGEG